MLILGGVMVATTLAALAVAQCPLVRAIRLNVRSFAEASRGAPELLR